MHRAIAMLVMMIVGQGAAAYAQPVTITRTFFVMPADGVPNNDQKIGDFCCTGRTASIVASSGTPVGYMYAFDFRDGVNFGDGTSGYGAVGLLLSGLSNSADPTSYRNQGAVWFSAGEIASGVHYKVTRVGALEFGVRVRHAALRDGRIDAG